MEVTKEQARQRFTILPPSLQDAVFSSEINEIVENLAAEHDLEDEQISGLARLVGRVLLGFQKLNELPDELEDAAGIPADKSKIIAQELDEKVFGKLRADIEKMNGLPVTAGQPAIPDFGSKPPVILKPMEAFGAASSTKPAPASLPNSNPPAAPRVEPPQVVNEKAVPRFVPVTPQPAQIKTASSSPSLQPKSAVPPAAPSPGPQSTAPEFRQAEPAPLIIEQEAEAKPLSSAIPNFRLNIESSRIDLRAPAKKSDPVQPARIDLGIPEKETAPKVVHTEIPTPRSVPPAVPKPLNNNPFGAIPEKPVAPPAPAPLKIDPPATFSYIPKTEQKSIPPPPVPLPVSQTGIPKPSLPPMIEIRRSEPKQNAAPAMPKIVDFASSPAEQKGTPRPASASPATPATPQTMDFKERLARATPPPNMAPTPVSAPSPLAPQAPPPVKTHPGFFGKLFGRKTHEETLPIPAVAPKIVNLSAYPTPQPPAEKKNPVLQTTAEISAPGTPPNPPPNLPKI